MSEAKFTKGIWESVEHLYNGSYEVTNSHSGEQICYLNQGEHNAHLIAAAPEMYAELENLLCLEGIINTSKIKAVLAKARGES